MLQQEAAHPPAGEVRVDEDGSNLGSVGGGVEPFGDPAGAVVAAEEGFAETPASAAGQDAGIGQGLGDEVGLVGDELCIEAESVAYRSFHLHGGIVVGLQPADGLLDESVERGDIGWGRKADGKPGRWFHGCMTLFILVERGAEKQIPPLRSEATEKGSTGDEAFLDGCSGDVGRNLYDAGSGALHRDQGRCRCGD